MGDDGYDVFVGVASAGPADGSRARHAFALVVVRGERRTERARAFPRALPTFEAWLYAIAEGLRLTGGRERRVTVAVPYRDLATLAERHRLVRPLLEACGGAVAFIPERDGHAEMRRAARLAREALASGRESERAA